MVNALKESVVIETGGMWEQSAFRITFDCEVSQTGGLTPCPHCGPVRSRTHTACDGSHWEEQYWTCPRVVEATNEGGCATTGVCLDCIVEAARELDK